MVAIIYWRRTVYKAVVAIPRLAAKPIVAKPVFELITQRAETDVFRRFDKIVLTRTQKKQCIVHRQKILFIPLEPKKISAHGSYVITMGWILRVWGPKRSQVLWSMTEGVLNDRNNIFMPIYYALFFLGTSNNCLCCPVSSTSTSIRAGIAVQRPLVRI